MRPADDLPEEDRPALPPMSPGDKAALAVAVLAFVVFFPSVWTTFIFDDHPLIVHNEYVHDWKWLPRAFTTHFWDVTRVVDTSDVRRYYRPIVTLSYLATWTLVGPTAWIFHLTNVVLHAIASGLAVRAALRWTSSVAAALVVGVVFAIHPSRTENVTWISGRTDLLMMVFVLLALELFAAFQRLRATSAARAWSAFGAGLLCVAIATLSKEPAALTPIVLLAEPSTPERKSSRLPFVVTAIACGAYLVFRAALFPPEVDVPRFFTPVHALVTVGAYVQRFVVPWPPTMYYHALLYDAGGPVYPGWLVALGAISLVAFLAALVFAWRRARTGFWLIVASAAFMGPLLNVYFTGMSVSAQDRFLYGPSLFGLAALAVLLRGALERGAKGRLPRLALAGAAVGWATLVLVRTADYRSEQGFWTAELRQNPDHPYVLQMLALTAARGGDLATANQYLRRADSPAGRRYFLATDGGVHFQRAMILAALLPDGRTAELRGLLDEVWRLVEPAVTPPPATVLDYEVGGHLENIDRSARTLTFHWDIALLATRLGDFDRAERVIRQSPASGLLASANPLNGALALTRLGRYSDARAVHAAILARRQELGDLASADELADFARRLDRAEQVADERDRAPSAPMRAMLEALRLAELGAYTAALRALDAGGVLELPEATPLVVQLLVAARLDDAARQRARRDLGDERGEAMVTSLLNELPPRVRAMPPASGDLKAALAAVAASPAPAP